MRQGNGSVTHLLRPQVFRAGRVRPTLRRAHEATMSGIPDPHLSPALSSPGSVPWPWASTRTSTAPSTGMTSSEARSLSAGHRLAAVMPALSQLLADETVDGPPFADRHRPRRAKSCGGLAAAGAAAGGLPGVCGGRRLVRVRHRHQRHQRGLGYRRPGAAVLRRAPGPDPPRLGLHGRSHPRPFDRRSCGRPGCLRTVRIRHAGQPADGALRRPAGGGAAETAGRRLRAVRPTPCGSPRGGGAHS